MNQFFSNELLQRCSELALQVSLWVTFGVSLLILLRKQSPRLLKQLGIGIMFGIIVLTVANLAIAPWWHIGSWLTAPKPAISDFTSIIIPTAPVATSASIRHWPSSLGAPSGVTYSASTTSSNTEPSSPWPWKEWLILVCVGLSSLLFLRLAIGLWQLHRLRQRARIVLDEKLHHIMATLKHHFEVSGNVEVRELAQLPGPLTFGHRQPVIMLPNSWRTWTEEELRCVLAHELGHISERDFLTYLLMQITRALHGYHPLVHWLYWRIASLLEIQTDVAAARCVGQELYIRAVCELVLKFPTDERSRMIAPSLGFGPLVPLSRRMSMLTLRPWSRPSKWTITALALVLPAALVLLLGLRTPTQAEDAPSTKQPGNTTDTLPVHWSPFVLDYLPSDAKTVLCFRPAQFAALSGNHLMPTFNSELDHLLGSIEFSLPSVRLQEIEQLVGVGESSLSLVKLLPGKRWKEIFAKDHPAMKAKLHANKTIYVLPKQPGKLGGIVEALGLIDEQTLIFGTRTFVETCLEGKHQKPAFRWSDKDWKTVESAWLVVGMDMQDLMVKARAQQSPYHDPDSVKKLIEAAKTMDYFFFAAYPGEQIDVRLLALRATGKVSLNDAADSWCRDFFRALKNLNVPYAIKKSMSEPVCDTARLAGQTVEVDRVVYHLKQKMTYSACFAAMQENEKTIKQATVAVKPKWNLVGMEIPEGMLPLELPVQPWVMEKNTPFFETTIRQITIPIETAQGLGVIQESVQKIKTISHQQLIQLMEAAQGDLQAHTLQHPRILHTGRFTYDQFLNLFDLNGSTADPSRHSSLTMNVSCHNAQWKNKCEFSQKVSKLVTNRVAIETTTSSESILLYTQQFTQAGKDFLFITVMQTRNADHVVVRDPEPKLLLKSWHLRVTPEMVEKLKIDWQDGANSSHEMTTVPEAVLFDAVNDWRNEKDFTLLASPIVMSKFEDKSQVEHGNLWEDVGAIRQQAWGKLINDRIRLNGEVLTMYESGKKSDGKALLAGCPVQFEGRVKPGECLLLRWTDEKGLCRIVAFCPRAIVQLGNKQSNE